MYFSRQDVSLFTFPMVVTAFFSAMMGGLLAPLVVNVAARLLFVLIFVMDLYWIYSLISNAYMQYIVQQ